MAGCNSRLLAHILLPTCQYPQVLFSRSVLSPYILQLVLRVGVALTQVQNPVHGFVEPHDIQLCY